MAMAENNNKKNIEQEDQNRAPVLTVLKNNAILKNIIIVLDDKDNEENQTVLIGRHPHCNIVLTHPSVSRFHLRIHSNPCSRTLSLVDLDSVHGTWVCGRKLKAGVSVELKEGDTFMVGFSSRVYRLSWVPLTQLDAFVPQQHEQDYQQEQIVKDENLELTVEREIPIAEDIVSLCCDEERKSHSEDEPFGVVNGIETLCGPANVGGENVLCGWQNHVLSPPYVHSVDEIDNVQNIEPCPEVEMPEDTNLLCTLREYLAHNLCLPAVEAVQGTKLQQFQAPPDTFTGQSALFEMNGFSLPINIDPMSFDEKDVAAVDVIPTESEFGCTHRDNDMVEDILTNGAKILNSEKMCFLVDEDIPDFNFQQIEVVEEVSMHSVLDGEKQDECIETKFQDLDAKSCCEEGYSLDEIDDDNGNKCIENIDPASFRDNERIKHIFETESRIVNSENTSLLDEEATKFQLIMIADEVAMDSISDTKKEDRCCKQLNPLPNAKSFQEQGNSLHEIVKDIACCTEKVVTAVTTMPTQSEFGCTLRDNERIEYVLATESRINNSENASLLDDDATKFQLIKIVEEVAMDSIPEAEKEKCGKEFQPCLEDSSEVVSQHSSMSQEAVLSISNKIENRTPESLTSVTGGYVLDILENCVEPTEKSSTFGNIWSRKGKAASAPQVRARKSRFMITSKVDTEVQISNVKVVINKSMPKDLTSVFDEEEETFTPNKENVTSNTHHLWSMRKNGNLGEIKHCKSQRSHNLKADLSPNIYSTESLSAVSNKVNQTPKVAQERKSWRKPLECRTNLAHGQDMMKLKKNRVERVPFQSLMNSGGNGKSVTVSDAKSIDDSRICGQISKKSTKSSHINTEQKRRWDMVVDTASLLNKESRKALQLLQGLKGTRLIIPGLVMKELGSMKQQFRIFRTTSEASFALEWIEECLEKTRWWVQIQSSMEESKLTGSPQTQFIEKSWTFPGFKISNESASPMLKDYMLDYALLYRRNEDVGQLVLLSDDVTLKIKSMAKGVLCETVQQFRQSLVNPFSERFMWPKSSPLGLTCSCHDDLVLREKYCGLPSKAGLKLINQLFLYSP